MPTWLTFAERRLIPSNYYCEAVEFLFKFPLAARLAYHCVWNAGRHSLCSCRNPARNQGSPVHPLRTSLKACDFITMYRDP